MLQEESLQKHKSGLRSRHRGSGATPLTHVFIYSSPTDPPNLRLFESDTLILKGGNKAVGQRHKQNPQKDLDNRSLVFYHEVSRSQENKSPLGSVPDSVLGGDLDPSPGLSIFTFLGVRLADLGHPSHGNILPSESTESTPSAIKRAYAYHPEAFSLPRVNLKQLLHIRSNFTYSGDSAIIQSASPDLLLCAFIKEVVGDVLIVFMRCYGPRSGDDRHYALC